MPGVAAEALFILILILANGVFSLSEIALVSVRQARLQQRADAGDAGARAALELSGQPDSFLSMVQVGITLVGILTGAFSGATLAAALTAQFETIPVLAPYGRTLGLGLVVAATTYLSLVIGELVPKRIGLTHPEVIASAVARPMQVLARLAAPVVWFLSASTHAITRLMGVRASDEPLVTEDEVRHLLRQGTRAGIFEIAEQEMVDRVFRLMDRRVGTLAVPRPDMIWFDVDAPESEVRERLSSQPHSYFVLCQESPDRVVGLVQAKDLAARFAAGMPLDLRASCRPALFVPESLRAVQLLEMFRESGNQFAVVVDEHGGTHGLVAATDLLEAIVGDLPALSGDGEREIVPRDDGSFLVDGGLAVDELKSRFGLRVLPHEDDGDYTTLGGLLAACLGRIPVEGDQTECEGVRFEVVDMDGLRVDKVLVRLPAQRSVRTDS